MSSLAGLGVDLERLDQQNPYFKLDIGAVLRRGFGAWRAGVVTYALITLLLHGPFTVATLLLQEPRLFTSLRDARPALLFGANLLSNLAGLILVGAITSGVVEHLRGQRTTSKALLRIGLLRAVPILGTGLLTGLATVLGCCALIVPGLVALTMFYVALPAVVIEEKGAFDTMQRSQMLTKGNRWEISGIILAVIAMEVLFSLPLIGLEAALSQFTTLSPVAVFSMRGVLAFALMPLNSLGAVMPAVVYHDLRVGREGADVDDLVKVFE